MSIVIGAVSDAGQVRAANEDHYVVLTKPDVAEGLDAVLVVADGMGGHRAGQIASELVADTFVRWFGSGGQATRQRAGLELRQALEHVVHEAHCELQRASSTSPRLRGLGSTVTGAVIADGILYLGHVGDSRAYLIRGGAIHQLSRDHSWVADQVRAGVMSAELASHHPRKNVLTRAVGGRGSIQVDTEAYQLDVGDVVLVCSDGLTNTISDAELLSIARTHAQPARAAEVMVRLANERGAPDNVTVLLARVVSSNQRGR